jgi:hypothetical protein
MSLEICNANYSITVSGTPSNTVTVEAIEYAVEVDVIDYIIQISGTQGIQGPQGEPGSDALIKIKRHAFVSSVSYCGVAFYSDIEPTENDDVWTIKKITVATDGTTTVLQATNVTWTDYLTHTYT